MTHSRKTMRRSEDWWALLAGPTDVRCEGHVQNGGRCLRPALFGTTVCSQHGGAAPQVRAKAAARIGNAADEMVKRLFAMLDDPETPHAVRSKIMQDMLDRAGLNATEKHEVKVDPVELLFKSILNDPNGLAAPAVQPREPSPQALAWNREALEAYGDDDDVVDAEVVEEPQDSHTIDIETVSSRPPKHIREGLERAEALRRLI